MAIRRKLESEIAVLQADLADANNEKKNADEIAKQAIANTVKLADDLKLEQVFINLIVT